MLPAFQDWCTENSFIHAYIHSYCIMSEQHKRLFCLKLSVSNQCKESFSKSSPLPNVKWGVIYHTLSYAIRRTFLFRLSSHFYYILWELLKQSSTCIYVAYLTFDMVPHTYFYIYLRKNLGTEHRWIYFSPKGEMVLTRTKMLQLVLQVEEHGPKKD